MKNIQVIDGAINAAYTIFSVTEDEFRLIFPDDGQDIEIIEDMVERLGDDRVGEIMGPVWDREVPKSEACGIHGTLFYGMPEKKEYYENKREPVINWKLID
ncbi:MAG: hypothetical protein EON59_01405 [Alphaproteobacteria bacterium]|nr:MAG: hypothetical protein EON59_01405 [Alphaproteobacteria bacterium]